MNCKCGKPCVIIERPLGVFRSAKRCRYCLRQANYDKQTKCEVGAALPKNLSMDQLMGILI